MDLPVGKERKEFWHRHVEGAGEFPGTLVEYCRENRIPLTKLSYYKRKLKRKSKFSEIKAVERFPQGSQVKGTESYPHRLPDPKWLSTLIRELSR